MAETLLDLSRLMPTKPPPARLLPRTGAFAALTSSSSSCCRPRTWERLRCCSAVDAAKLADGDVFSVTLSGKSDIDYLGESTKGNLNVRPEHLDALGFADGEEDWFGP